MAIAVEIAGQATEVEEHIAARDTDRIARRDRTEGAADRRSGSNEPASTRWGITAERDDIERTAEGKGAGG